MYYSDDALKDLQANFQSLEEKLNTLSEKFILKKLSNSSAREYATQGFPRRLKIMVRCIQNVFSMLPPDRTDLPSRHELSDATINIQSFVFNVFGSVDNLAWIWVNETGQKRRDGTPIASRYVGLGRENVSVRETLSMEFQNYLRELDIWFEQIGNLRHALAHRIPLYIPPYVIANENEKAYQELGHKMVEAIKSHDSAEYDRLSVEQMKLGRFRPWVQHSFEESQKPIVFHAQMLGDFDVVGELGQRMLQELARFQDEPP